MPRMADPRFGIRDWAPLLLALLFLVGASLWINVHKSIWVDENITLVETGGTIRESIRSASSSSNKPPVYFVLVNLWRRLNPTIEFTRALSLLFIVAAVVYLHRLSLALGIRFAGFTVGVVAAFTPHLLWASAEARPYALTVLCLSGALYHFVRFAVEPAPHPNRDAALFVAWCYAGMLTFYYTGFVLLALFVAGLAGRDLRRLVWSGVVLTALMVPWAATVSTHLAAAPGSYLQEVVGTDAPGAEGAIGPLAFAGNRALSSVFRATPLFSRPVMAEALAGLLLMLLALRVWRGQPRWSREETLFAIFAGVGFAVMLALRAVNVTTVDERHWIVVVPGLLILPALLASRLPPGALRTGFGGVLGLIVVAGGLSYVRNERGPRDWKSPARIISEREHPGEPIITFDSQPASFLYYYHGPNAVLRSPRDDTARRDKGRRYEYTRAEIRHLRIHLALSQPPGRRFWIVEHEWAGRAVDALAPYVPGRLEVLEQWSFHHSRLYLVRLIPDTTGATP